MEIRFEVGLKRPRDATGSAKLVSEAAVAVRCHARILLIRLQRIYNFLLFHAILYPVLNIIGLYYTLLYYFWD